MKYLFSILLVTFITSSINAQVESSTKSLPIQRSSGSSIPTSNNIPNATSKNPFISRTQKAENYPTPKKEEFSMRTDNGLMTAGDFVEKKWTEDAAANEGHRENQYLGDHVTSGKFVEVYCRDYQYVDGDRVRITVNGKLIMNNLELGSNFTPVLVTLEPGFNTIEFEALNQGASGPNTAALKVLGELGELISTSEWNLLTGAKASMIIVKQ